jgi:hypothetical protein
MKYLQLEKHLIPIILIKYVSVAELEATEEGEPIIYISTAIHFRDGTEIVVDEDFDVVCELLNPIT